MQPVKHEMIDAAALAKMGITVSEEGDNNALVAHLPLQMAHDNRTGVTSGFAATMRYDTSWPRRRRQLAAPGADELVGAGA